ncbi:MAG: M949_RS01915 family surface polysaccharide biosynthesis protein [Emticicia sp.]|uniref:M949_RS01915 family surface polysaccharide biosynthesis protein n=1 Tax=Emticicia sp. TaxID=1930953 RepID=UPI003BA61173
MKKIIGFISCFISLSSFSQQIATKNIEPSILRKIVSDDAIVDKALQFEDKNGKNYLVATTLQNRSDEWVTKAILVQHYVEKSNKELVLLRQITDKEEHCEFDNDLQLLTESLRITDLDKNKYAEITFLYKLGCRSDVSPIGLKLMVIENGNKAAIRGNTIPRGFDYPKEKVADGSFKKLPKLIQDQANKLWDKFAPEF